MRYKPDKPYNAINHLLHELQFSPVTTSGRFVQSTCMPKLIRQLQFFQMWRCFEKFHHPIDDRDGYATNNIRYCWKDKEDFYKKSVTIQQEAKTLPQFSVTAYSVSQTVSGTSTGKYSRLKLEIVFSRSIGFYIIQIYLPSILIVIISWVSFWLSRDATPARVALGVTTVLTMTTLMTTTNAAMPKVSYIKSIDLYLGVCFIMVFASLLEYAAVGYLNKHLRMRREKKMERVGGGFTGRGIGSSNGTSKKAAFVTNATEAMIPPGFINNPRTAQGPQWNPTSVTPLPAPISRTGYLSSSILQGGVECDCDLEEGEHHAHPLKLAKPPKRRKGRSLRPSTIDKYSRIIFPLLFLIFNATYWSILYYLSNNQKTRFAKMDPPINGSSPETDDCFKDTRYYRGGTADLTTVQP